MADRFFHSLTSKGKAKIVLVLFLLSFSTQFAFATDITISGNGAESVNAGTVSLDQTTQVTQTNTADVTNTVSQTADTGSNSSSSGTGQSVITTGNASQQTEIANDVNQATSEVGCCSDTSTSTAITGNGAGSTNTGNTNLSENTTVTQTQNATIKNTITGVANTGGNTAKNNSGDVTIKTGNITSVVAISNEANTSFAQVSERIFSLETLVKGNGADSTNTIYSTYTKNNLVTQGNTSTFDNNVYLSLSTGNNSVNSNTDGIIKILTGDIWSNVSITNNANNNIASVSTCQKPEEITPTPTQAPGIGGNGGSSNGSGGQITETAASTESHGVGGPSIFGLSDTSGDSFPLYPTMIAMLAIGSMFLLSGVKPYSLRVTISLNY